MKINAGKIDYVVVLLKNGESVRIYPQSIAVSGSTLSIEERGLKG